MYDPNADPELLKLDTDLCLFGDEGFRPFAMKVSQSVSFSPCVSVSSTHTHPTSNNLTPPTTIHTPPQHQRKQYKDSQADFFKDYAVSHAKLSELGAEWEVAGGVSI